MQRNTHFCDLCLGEGRVRLAAAQYQNKEGDWWDACPEHLATVKVLQLHYEEFEERGNIDLSNYG